MLVCVCLCVCVQELILPLLLLGLLILISTLNPHVYYGAINTAELPNDDFFQNLKGLAFTPITNITSHIMDEVAHFISKSLPSMCFICDSEEARR